MPIRVGTCEELGLDGQRVADFYRDNWIRRIPLADYRFYKWQFRSVPSAPDIDNCMVAVDQASGRIAGVMGLNARRFSFQGNWWNGAELTTWIVLEEFRRTGAGARILGEIQSRFDVLIGMGISDIALPLYMRSGFRFLAGIPRFVKVIEFEHVATISSHQPLARKLSLQWANSTTRLPYRVVEGITSDVTTVFERASRWSNLFIRDYEHLRWRYGSHPYFKYRGFTIATPDGDTAFLCAREETSLPQIRILHVLDCFGDEGAISPALCFLEDFARENRFHAVDFYCTSTSINRILLATGWFSMLDDACLGFPHLFHPIELRNPATTSLIYWSRNQFQFFCDFSRLYITKQDCDLDRPILKS